MFFCFFVGIHWKTLSPIAQECHVSFQHEFPQEYLCQKPKISRGCEGAGGAVEPVEPAADSEGQVDSRSQARELHKHTKQFKEEEVTARGASTAPPGCSAVTTCTLTLNAARST